MRHADKVPEMRARMGLLEGVGMAQRLLELVVAVQRELEPRAHVSNARRGPVFSVNQLPRSRCERAH
eukprot:8196852-Alexandrium_andersonii.AAC.1